MEKIKKTIVTFQHDGKAILRVTFWVMRAMAGILAMNSEVYKCNIKHVSFTLGAVIGFLVVAEVIWEIHTLVRASILSESKK